MKKHIKKPQITTLTVSKDILVDLNHIKYSLGLKSYYAVLTYLIDQERKRNDL
jgi:hypothetical protein